MKIKWNKNQSINIVCQLRTETYKHKLTLFASYVTGLSEEFRRIFHYTSIQVVFKSNNTLKSILMHPKNKIPLHLKRNVVSKSSWPEENCIQFNICKFSGCPKNYPTKTCIFYIYKTLKHYFRFYFYKMNYCPCQYYCNFINLRSLEIKFT